MPITEEQRNARLATLGSSDLPVVLAVSPWKRPMDLYLERIGDVEPEPPNQAMSLGNRLEAAVLDFAEQGDEDYRGLGPLTRNVNLKAPNGAPIAANIDATVDETGNPVEAKTVGMRNYRMTEAWGEPLTDEIPDDVFVQCQTHLLCAERDTCYVAAFLAGRGMHRYEVQRDDELIEMMIEAARAFWECIQTRTPPPDVETSPEIARRRPRVEGKVVEATPEQVAQLESWQRLQKESTAAEKAKKAALNDLIVSMGDAQGIDFGEKLFVMCREDRKAYTVEAKTIVMPRLRKK